MVRYLDLAGSDSIHDIDGGVPGEALGCGWVPVRAGVLVLGVTSAGFHRRDTPALTSARRCFGVPGAGRVPGLLSTDRDGAIPGPKIGRS